MRSLRQFVILCALTTLSCAVPTAQAATGARLANFEQRLVGRHNSERAHLGVPPLQWSPQLAAEAAKWAAHLSTLDGLEHDGSLEVEGENLWRGSKDAYTPEDMVTLWIDEKAAFKYGPVPDVSITGQFDDVGHYTQVVWRSTSQVGCAIATAGDDEVLVCRYMEGGNMEGEKPY